MTYGSCDDVPDAGSVSTAAEVAACWAHARTHFRNNTLDPDLGNLTRGSVYQVFMIVLSSKTPIIDASNLPLLEFSANEDVAANTQPQQPWGLRIAFAFPVDDTGPPGTCKPLDLRGLSLGFSLSSGKTGQQPSLAALHPAQGGNNTSTSTSTSGGSGGGSGGSSGSSSSRGSHHGRRALSAMRTSQPRSAALLDALSSTESVPRGRAAAAAGDGDAPSPLLGLGLYFSGCSRESSMLTNLSLAALGYGQPSFTFLTLRDSPSVVASEASQDIAISGFVLCRALCWLHVDGG
jgi:hypothetical protein